jgi:hypothetical protein
VAPKPEPPPLPTRRLRLFLRDFRLVEGSANMPKGITLTAYLANRRGYLRLVDLRLHPSGGAAAFAVVRVSHLLYAAAANADVPLASATPAARPHPVELLLDGGLFVRGGILLGPRQRLSDYLESAGNFVPVTGAELLRSDRQQSSTNVLWGDIVVNQDAIQAAWDSPRMASGGRKAFQTVPAAVDEPL